MHNGMCTCKNTQCVDVFLIGSNSKTQGPDPALINLTTLLLQSSLVMRIILSLGEQDGVGVWTSLCLEIHVLCALQVHVGTSVSVCVQ